MSNLLKKVEEIKRKEASLKKELEDLENKKKQEADKLSSELDKTLEEIFLEEKEKYEEIFKKKELEEFLGSDNTNQDNNKGAKFDEALKDPSNLYSSPMSSVYNAVKKISSLQNPSEAQREFIKNIAYNINKAKTTEVYDPNNYVSRMESLLKKPTDKKSDVDLYDLDAKPY